MQYALGFFFAIENWYLVQMRNIRKKILALSSLLALLSECFLGYFRHEVAESSRRQEYQLPDDHTHCEDSQPALRTQMAAQEIAPPPVPFAPDDDSQMYGAFLLPQHDRKTPYLSDLIASE
jgi:hypothetical protein